MVKGFRREGLNLRRPALGLEVRVLVFGVRGESLRVGFRVQCPWFGVYNLGFVV